MAFDFPNFPTDGMTITGPGGTRYQWNAAADNWRVPTADQWVTQSELEEATRVRETVVSDTAPASPDNGDLWFDTTTQELKIWNAFAGQWQVTSASNQFLPLSGGQVAQNLYLSESNYGLNAFPAPVTGTWSYFSNGAAATIGLTPVGLIFSVAPIGTAGAPTNFGLPVLALYPDGTVQGNGAVRSNGIMAILRVAGGPATLNFDVGAAAGQIYADANYFGIGFTGPANIASNARMMYDRTTGQLQWNNTPGGITMTLQASGNLIIPGTLTQSDERLKHDIRPASDGLEVVQRLLPKRFRRNLAPDEVDLGFIAQDLQAVLPDAVRDVDNVGLAIGIVPLIAVLVNAVKELAARVQQLEGART